MVLAKKEAGCYIQNKRSGGFKSRFRFTVAACMITLKPKLFQNIMLQVRLYFLLGFFQLRFGYFQFGLGKVQVVGRVNGNKVQVRVRHFDANYRKAAAVAGKGAFNCFGDGLCKKKELR